MWPKTTTATSRIHASLTHQATRGFQLPNVVRMFANHETFFGAFVEMIRALYVEGKLSPRHRELAYLRASQINGCHY